MAPSLVINQKLIPQHGCSSNGWCCCPRNQHCCGHDQGTQHLAVMHDDRSNDNSSWLVMSVGILAVDVVVLTIRMRNTFARGQLDRQERKEKSTDAG